MFILIANTPHFGSTSSDLIILTPYSKSMEWEQINIFSIFSLKKEVPHSFFSRTAILWNKLPRFQFFSTSIHLHLYSVSFYHDGNLHWGDLYSKNSHLTTVYNNISETPDYYTFDLLRGIKYCEETNSKP